MSSTPTGAAGCERLGIARTIVSDSAVTWSSFCWIAAASSRMRRPSSFSASRFSGGALPIERAVSLALRLASSNCDCSVLRSFFQRDEAIDIGRGVAVLAVVLDEFDVIDDEFAVEHGSAGRREFRNGEKAAL